MGLAVGLAALREFTDNTLRDAGTHEALAGMPIFGVVPSIVTAEDQMRLRRKRLSTVFGSVFGVAMVLLLFHFLVMDLYVFYAKLERFLYRSFRFEPTSFTLFRRSE